MNKYIYSWLDDNINIYTYVFREPYHDRAIESIEEIDFRDENIIWGRDGRSNGPFIISRKNSEHGLSIVMNIISTMLNKDHNANIIIQFMRRSLSRLVLYKLSLLSKYHYSYYHYNSPLEVLNIIKTYIK